MNNNFEIQVLVNGHKCKQYSFNGRIYIEAKHGTEYELEIKNNTWSRIFCLSSVDGLNVLTGQPAREDDAGYVIPAYSPLRIKGFRYSNNEVGAFKFTTKDNSYAHSQGGCEAAKNCGVIGFRLYNELVKLPQWNISWSQQPYWSKNNPYYDDGTICHCCDDTTTCCTDDPVYGSSTNKYSKGITSSWSGKSNNTIKTANFDMGSTWGQKVESKVVETDFEKGCLAFNLDIYYASRQNLIDMGVPINVGHQVSFPQSFPNKYATPPSGWRG